MQRGVTIRGCVRRLSRRPLRWRVRRCRPPRPCGGVRFGWRGSGNVTTLIGSDAAPSWPLVSETAASVMNVQAVVQEGERRRAVPCRRPCTSSRSLRRARRPRRCGHPVCRSRPAVPGGCAPPRDDDRRRRRVGEAGRRQAVPVLASCTRRLRAMVRFGDDDAVRRWGKMPRIEGEEFGGPGLGRARRNDRIVGATTAGARVGQASE